jgi:pyruvate,water dikinase
LALTRYAVALEKHFQRPQDIEWSLDADGRLIILQTRPLQVYGRSTRQQEGPDAESIPGYTVLLAGGEVACPGVGFGRAHHVRSDEDLLSFPEGGVLIAEQPSPKYLVVFPKAQAVVADSGSITGHMAALAREFMLPAVLNTRQATRVISQGEMVTVDAFSARIYRGEVPELLELKLPKGRFMLDSPVFTTLKKAAALIVPLHLLDPKSPEFTPGGCRTIHDIMRFVHEMSYKEIFNFSDRVSNEGSIAVKLKATLPLDLFIIDLGGGLILETPGERTIKPEQVGCKPFTALLKGMLREDLRSLEPRPVQLGGFVSVMTRQMLSPPNIELERFGEKSYAIISDKYMNFSSRVGYHYSVVDAYSGQNVNKNYVNFQFKGGAADDVRRNRRTRAIGRVLQELGFTVDIKGDMVNARLNKREAGVMADALDQLGRLLIYTRQMDMLMNGEGSVGLVAECFLKGDYNLHLRHGDEERCPPSDR